MAGRVQAWLLRDRAAQRWRAPWLAGAFLVVVVVLFLAAYLVDRHRTASAAGTVRGWLAAGAAGDCERYRELESPQALAADLAAGVPPGFEAVPGTVTDDRERLCRTLVQRFGRLTVTSAAAEGATVRVVTAAGATIVPVVRLDGRWRVADARLRTCALGPADTVPLPSC